MLEFLKSMSRTAVVFLSVTGRAELENVWFHVDRLNLHLLCSSDVVLW